jgi:hypothetical protein
MKPLIEQRGALMFRRPVSAEEQAHYLGIATRGEPQLGREDAAALTFQAMLMSPWFMFRTELGEGPPDAQGLVRLSPHEVASALSYAFTDAPPGEELWKAAEARALATPEQIRPFVERFAERLLGSPAAPEKPTAAEAQVAVRFFREYLRYDHATDVFKDAKDFPFHKPEDLESDTELWVRDALATSGRQGLLKTLLTSPAGFVRGSTRSSYGLDKTVASNAAPAKVTFPAGQRAGILTQPSFLAAYSVANENEPVQRGRFVAESLLCQKVPDLPIGQVPKLPDLGPNATVRDRLKMHSADPACWACHKMLDPLGLAFEQYDHTGRFRASLVGQPVDASGELYATGNADGPFKNPIEMAGRLAGSPAVTQCFVRHAFRYWMGREELASDGCSVAAAQAAFDKDGGNYVELLAALFTSRAFLTRAPSAP